MSQMPKTPQEMKKFFEDMKQGTTMFEEKLPAPPKDKTYEFCDEITLFSVLETIRVCQEQKHQIGLFMAMYFLFPQGQIYANGVLYGLCLAGLVNVPGITAENLSLTEAGEAKLKELIEKHPHLLLQNGE